MLASFRHSISFLGQFLCWNGEAFIVWDGDAEGMHLHCKSTEDCIYFTIPWK